MRKQLVSVVLTILLVGACGTTESDDGSTTPDQPTTTRVLTSPGTDEAGTTELIMSAVEGLAKAYERTEGVWDGFKPNDHPSAIAFKDSTGDLIGTVAVNHPRPEAMGDAKEMSVEGTPFRSLHRIENPVEEQLLQDLSGFDFHAKLGGLDSFAMIAGGPDTFFDPDAPDWSSTWIHELFHRYQDEAFKGDIGSQDVEGYAYTAGNLALAALEDRALIAALEAPDDSARREAARQFAAIRIDRLRADSRVVLDNDQERFEGSARFIEHQFAGDDTSYVYHDGNYARELPSYLSGDIKDTFGFGRFYATGSAVLRLTQLAGLDTDKIVARVEQGEPPADILADHLDVTSANVDELVDEAKRTYDPLDELPDQARKAADLAVSEPSVFGDQGDSVADEADGDIEPTDGNEVTAEEAQCLDDAGLSDGEIIPDEIFERCIAS